MTFLFVLLCGFRDWIAKMNLLTLFWGEEVCRADSDLERREMTMASLSKKGHRPSKTIGREQEHGSYAKKNHQTYSEGNRPSNCFLGKGERPNESFGGGKKRSSALFGHEGERPNATRAGE